MDVAEADHIQAERLVMRLNNWGGVGSEQH